MQYPKDFIKNAYEMIRAKGGVCVADEVNTCKAYYDIICVTTQNDTL